MKLTAWDFALMSFHDAWRNAHKGDGLSQAQRRVLGFVCAKSRGGLPFRFSNPYLARMFGCDVEEVREVFEFLEHRHLLYRHENRNGRKQWRWLSHCDRHRKCTDVLMEQTLLLSGLCAQEHAAAHRALLASFAAWCAERLGRSVSAVLARARKRGIRAHGRHA